MPTGRSTLRQIIAVTLFALCLVAAPAPAAPPLAGPAGPVILTVSGEIGRTNTAHGADFDRAQLMAIGWRKISTYTPWTEGLQAFEGVPLDALLDHVGATGEQIFAIALNDYKVTVPVADAREHGLLLALKHNGAFMSVRNKGPLWIIYPYPQSVDAIPDVHAARMVWQLRTLRVE